MSGKSTWIKKVLIHSDQLIRPVPDRILWIYKRWQPLYDELKYWIPSIVFIEGITEDIKYDTVINSRKRTLLIIDDMMKDATQDKEICELFTEGAHHRNLSVVCIMQNLFNKGKENRTMSLNSQYIVLFKNPRDRQQIGVLARQMYPGNSQKLLDAYEKAVSVPYGALVLDLKQTTLESKRFQTDIFGPHIRAHENSGRHLTTEHQTKKTSPDHPPYNNYLHTEDQREEMAYQKPYQHYHEKAMLNRQGHYGNHIPYPWPLQPSTRTAYSDQRYMFPSCSKCGVMFASPYDLQRHAENGCPMKMDTDDDEMSDTSDNDGGFLSLVNEVWEENQSQFDRKFAQLVEKNSELSKKEAREEVTEMMLPKERALLLKKYKKIFLISEKLNESKLHRDIKKAVSTLMEETDMDLERTLSRVLNRYRHEFDSLLEADESHFKENSDEEHDMED